MNLSLYLFPNFFTKVMYIRNYPPKKSFFSEPLLMKGWNDLFESTNKKEIEEEISKSRLECEWKVRTDNSEGRSRKLAGFCTKICTLFTSVTVLG